MIVAPKTYEERLSYLFHVNPDYASEILELMIHNPEFLSIGHLIPLTERPVNFNLNKNEPYNVNAPANVFEFLLYYIAEAGVNANYGNQQWNKIRDYIRLHKADPLTNLVSSVDLQPKKQQVYNDLNKILIKHNINPYDLTLTQVISFKKEVKGIGDGCITFLQSLYATKFTNETTLPNYSDIGFQKGFMKFYKMDKKPTKKQVFEKSKDWSNIRVVNALMMQCYHYL